MKKTELEDLRQQSVEELQASIKENREELLKGRFEQVAEGTGHGVKSRQLRRDIARKLTLINEKKKAEVQA